jgi:hypothetical protein
LVAETAEEVLSKQISEVSPDVNAVTATVRCDEDGLHGIMER